MTYEITVHECDCCETKDGKVFTTFSNPRELLRAKANSYIEAIAVYNMINPFTWVLPEAESDFNEHKRRARRYIIIELCEEDGNVINYTTQFNNSEVFRG